MSETDAPPGQIARSLLAHAMPHVLHVARTLGPAADRLRAMPLAGALSTVWADLDGH